MASRRGERLITRSSLEVGQATALVFQRGDHRHRVVIGKDTRLSVYMIETALTAGFLSVGMDVLVLGPMPTPAIAMLTRSMRADLGVMISASHKSLRGKRHQALRPFDGYKLSDEIEREIEALLAVDLTRGCRNPWILAGRSAWNRHMPLYRVRQAHACRAT